MYNTELFLVLGFVKTVRTFLLAPSSRILASPKTRTHLLQQLGHGLNNVIKVGSRRVGIFLTKQTQRSIFQATD